MDSFLQNFITVGTQVIVLFVLIGTGAASRIFKILDDGAIKCLTTLLLTIVTTSLLIVSFQREATPDQISIAGWAAVFGILFHIVNIALATLLIHDKDKSREAVLRFSVVFTNAGFMSIPLQQAILGNDGVFCGAVIVGTFQLFVWTYGLWLMSGDIKTFSIRKIALNPGILGLAIAMIFFFGKVKLPEVIESPLRHLSNLNTPLAMIVIGYHLAGAGLNGIFHDVKGLCTIALRLVAAPVVFILLLQIFGIDNDTLLTASVIAASAPAAAITSMFAVQYRHNHIDLSVELVSLSTLLSVITMPLVVAIAIAI